MKREPQTNSTKDRLVAWLKKVGKQLLAFLQDAWQRFKKKLKQVWHRYQLTRWLIVVFLSLFLLMSIHLTFVAKTSDVKNLQNRLSRPTMIYEAVGRQPVLAKGNLREAKQHLLECS